MYTLLIVDDEPEIVERLWNLLHEAFSNQISISRTSSSREANEDLEKRAVDILLTDIKMPGFSGFQLAQTAHSSNPNCKVIYLTGYNEFNYAYEAIKTECEDYILKISNEQEIVSVIQRTIIKLADESKKEKLLKQATLISELAEPKTQPEYLEAVPYVKKYIWKHIDGDLSLQKLSALVYLNPAYLSRIFKQETGLNITDYITNARIQRAKEILVQTACKIQEISQRVGIDSPVYFCRLFKKETGYTPLEYRHKHQS